MRRVSTDFPDWERPYQMMRHQFGPQHWWPGDTPFEVMVGAILTQNTAWSNVERAIANLKAAEALSCMRILSLAPDALAQLIRPAGYFNVKARRLAALCAFLDAEQVAGEPYQLRDRGSVPELRQRLLSVYGVGEETADSILLYALSLPSFVVDTYTRRIFSRLGLLSGEESYATIQASFTTHLPRDTALYNEYHALIVQLGKDYCRPRPRCETCPLRSICKHPDQ